MLHFILLFHIQVNITAIYFQLSGSETVKSYTNEELTFLKKSKEANIFYLNRKYLTMLKIQIQN